MKTLNPWKIQQPWNGQLQWNPDMVTGPVPYLPCIVGHYDYGKNGHEYIPQVVIDAEAFEEEKHLREAVLK